MDNNDKHDLFYELNAFDVHWQKNYKSLLDAARAAGIEDVYTDFLTTDAGQIYVKKVLNISRDWVKINEELKAQRAAEIKMASNSRRGYKQEMTK